MVLRGYLPFVLVCCACSSDDGDEESTTTDPGAGQSTTEQTATDAPSAEPPGTTSTAPLEGDVGTGQPPSQAPVNTSPPSGPSAQTTTEAANTVAAEPVNTQPVPDSNSPTPNPTDEPPETGNPIDPSPDTPSDGEPTSSEQPSLPLPLGDPVEEERAAIPTARGEHGVAALNGEVYVLGGFTPSVTASVQAYDPAQDTWRDVADFPVVFHHPNVAAVDGQLYVLGFHAGMGQRAGDGSSYAYDPTTDEWTERASMPLGTERGASCVAVFEGKVYVFGGTNDVAMAESSVYDPAADTWYMLPLLPALRHHCIAAVVNDRIYIVSGRDVVIEEVQAESYVFDPVEETYEEVAPILTPRGGAAGGELGGRIYVFGGEGNAEDPNGIFHEAEVYDPASDTWEPLPDMNVPRHGFGAAVIGDRMYLPGGSVRQGIAAQTTHSVFYIAAP